MKWIVRHLQALKMETQFNFNIIYIYILVPLHKNHINIILKLPLIRS